ncbi:hypothetical protein J6590_039412 [Homalodisca vitripennis]|nr:hypothetical protein J6590_039412 [Homalodisca vitripennis]
MSMLDRVTGSPVMVVTMCQLTRLPCYLTTGHTGLDVLFLTSAPALDVLLQVCRNESYPWVKIAKGSMCMTDRVTGSPVMVVTMCQLTRLPCYLTTGHTGLDVLFLTSAPALDVLLQMCRKEGVSLSWNCWTFLGVYTPRGSMGARDWVMEVASNRKSGTADVFTSSPTLLPIGSPLPLYQASDQTQSINLPSLITTCNPASFSYYLAFMSCNHRVCGQRSQVNVFSRLIIPTYDNVIGVTAVPFMADDSLIPLTQITCVMSAVAGIVAHVRVNDVIRPGDMSLRASNASYSSAATCQQSLLYSLAYLLDNYQHRVYVLSAADIVSLIVVPGSVDLLSGNYCYNMGRIVKPMKQAGKCAFQAEVIAPSYITTPSCVIVLINGGLRSIQRAM